ncbi:MAG: XdhC family protein, partial [Anaerolineae bacterium]|nr:XdhC family protein [Anaerolineae bacterium]
MKDVLQQTQTWHDAGQAMAVATVVDTWGSAPRPVGSKLVATADGRFAGSVSAGCVEGAVLEQCEKAIRTGQAALLTYGVADEEAWEVGLACGGTIRVWVEPFSVWQPIFPALAEGLHANRSLAVVSPLR